MKVLNIPRDEKIKLLYAIKRLHAEGKIRKRSNKAWGSGMRITEK